MKKQPNGSKGELEILKYLEKYNYTFEREKTFQDLLSKKGGRLRFDFYLPNLKTVIEYQGRQHGQPVKIFGGKRQFKIQKENDKLKRKWCKKNKIKLIEIWYDEDVKRELNKRLKKWSIQDWLSGLLLQVLFWSFLCYIFSVALLNNAP